MGVGGMCFPQCGWSWESVWWSSRLCTDLEPGWIPAAPSQEVFLCARKQRRQASISGGGWRWRRSSNLWHPVQPGNCSFASEPASHGAGGGGFPDCQGYREQLLSRILPTTGESRSSAGAKHPSGPNCKETLGGMATNLPFVNEV